LWMPVLAICNLYISIAAANDLQRLATAGTDPLSMVGLDSVWTETASWLAFGGMMVAATPLLSLILITGSYFALTSLTNRLSGGAHVDPKTLSPDVLQNGPVASVGSLGSKSVGYAEDPVHGLHSYGADRLAPQISLGSSLSYAQQSRSNYAQDASEKLIHEAFAGTDLSRRQGVEGFISSYKGESAHATATETDRVLQGLARSVVNDEARFKELGTRDATALSGAAALGLMGMGSGAQVQQALQNIQGASDGEKQQWARRIEQLGRREEGHGVDLARAIVHDEQEGARSQFTRALGVQHGERWSDAVGATLSAVKSYDEVSSTLQSSDLRQSISSLAYGQIAAQTGTTQELINMVSHRGLPMNAVQDIAGTFLRRGWSPSVQHAFGAAAAIVLQNGSVDSALDLARYTSQHFGAFQLELHDPKANQGLQGMAEGALPAFESAQAGVAHQLTESSSNAAATAAQIDGHLGWFGEAGSAGLKAKDEAAVQKFFRDEHHDNQGRVAQMLADLEREGAAQQGKAVESTWQDTRSLVRFLNEQNLVERLDATASAHWRSSLREGAQRAHSTYDEVLAKTGSRAVASAASLAAGASGLVNGWDRVRDEKYAEALNAAQSHGLPAEAARYYAAESARIYEKPNVQIQIALGHSENYNRARSEAVQKMGPTGMEALQRAAEAPGDTRERYLDEARVLYQGEHPAPAH
jgi:hypothetical protein